MQLAASVFSICLSGGSPWFDRLPDQFQIIKGEVQVLLHTKALWSRRSFP